MKQGYEVELCCRNDGDLDQGSDIGTEETWMDLRDRKVMQNLVID